MANNSIVPAPERMKTLVEALNKSKGSMSAVAARIVTPDKLIKIAIAAAQRTPLLLQCTPASIVRSVMQGAELGLTPGSALNQAYLVPFKNKTTNAYEAQLIISAQGLSELAYRSGLIAFICAEVVYEGDEFEYELGLDPKLKHKPTDESIDATKITHAYMVVGLKDGSRVFRVMTRNGIDRIRAMSQSGNNGPWGSHYAEMARKTVIKNGMKYVPKSVEVARAIALDNAVDSGDFSALDFDLPESLPNPEDTPALPPTDTKAIDQLAEKVKSKSGTPEEAIDPYDGPTVRDEGQAGLME